MVDRTNDCVEKMLKVECAHDFQIQSSDLKNFFEPRGGKDFKFEDTIPPAWDESKREIQNLVMKVQSNRKLTKSAARPFFNLATLMVRMMKCLQGFPNWEPVKESCEKLRKMASDVVKNCKKRNVSDEFVKGYEAAYNASVDKFSYASIAENPGPHVSVHMKEVQAIRQWVKDLGGWQLVMEGNPLSADTIDFTQGSRALMEGRKDILKNLKAKGREAKDKRASRRDAAMQAAEKISQCVTSPDKGSGSKQQPGRSRRGAPPSKRKGPSPPPGKGQGKQKGQARSKKAAVAKGHADLGRE